MNRSRDDCERCLKRMLPITTHNLTIPPTAYRPGTLTTTTVLRCPKCGHTGSRKTTSNIPRLTT